MAVQNVLLGSGNGNREIDWIDIVALMVIPIFTSLLFGVWSWQIEVFGGYDFTAALWTVAGINISITLLVIVGSVAWVFLTNVLNPETELSDEEMVFTATALLLPILYVFVPSVETLVTWHDMIRLAGVLYVTAATVFVSYRG